MTRGFKDLPAGIALSAGETAEELDNPTVTPGTELCDHDTASRERATDIAAALAPRDYLDAALADRYRRVWGLALGDMAQVCERREALLAKLDFDGGIGLPLLGYLLELPGFDRAAPMFAGKPH